MPKQTSKNKPPGAQTKTALCFFCQRRFPRERLTREHVFGQWLIDRCRLENAKLTFANGTTTRYRSLCVSACNKCNNEFGSRFEAEIKAILDRFDEHRDELVSNDLVIAMRYGPGDSIAGKIAIWLQKIVFGILYFEAHLPGISADRRKWIKESVVFRHMRGSIRNGVAFSLVGSLIVFELQSHEEIFDFIDNLDPLAVGLKIDNKLFFLAVADGQLTSAYLHGDGLQGLREDVFANKFGTGVSHLMAFAYALAIRLNLPVSPKFVFDDRDVMNLSTSGLGPHRPIDGQQVVADARDAFRALCESRGIQVV